jgi:hypothetical protein
MQTASRKAGNNIGASCFFDRNKAVYESLEESFNTFAGSRFTRKRKNGAESEYCYLLWEQTSASMQVPSS